MITLYSLLTIPEQREVAHVKAESFAVFQKDFSEITVAELVMINQTAVFDWPYTDLLFSDLYKRYGERVESLSKNKKQ